MSAISYFPQSTRKSNHASIIAQHAGFQFAITFRDHKVHIYLESWQIGFLPHQPEPLLHDLFSLLLGLLGSLLLHLFFRPRNLLPNFHPAPLIPISLFSMYIYQPSKRDPPNLLEENPLSFHIFFPFVTDSLMEIIYVLSF